ncbi:MAG: putative Ig domain-containing protein [Steroidobacteraceae bacterium]
MIRATRSVSVASFVTSILLVAGCGDAGTSTSGTTSAATSATGTIDRPGSQSGATISGVPATTAVAGEAYSFKPQVANTSSTAVSFSIEHQPGWAKFDPKTGQLSGTPSTSQVGQYSGIAITLLAGNTSVALPAFSITVAEPTSSDTVSLSWQAPTANADGTALVDLKGYKVHYGSASKSYSDVIQVANPGLTTYVVQNLPAGKYYFAVTAYNATGTESALSGEVSTQVVNN